MSASKLRVQMRNGDWWQIDVTSPYDLNVATLLLQNWQAYPHGVTDIHAGNGTFQVDFAEIDSMTFKR